MPSTLITIGNGVFEGHALTSIEIPGSVISIGYAAFAGNALSTINLPAGLEFIGDRAFENNQISNLLLPDGLTFIGWSAFQNNKIVSLSVPNSLTHIGEWAFSNNAISNLTFQSGSLLEEIPAWCFSSNDIKNLNIPGGILVINDGAFNNNVNLSNVAFGANLLKIKSNAFSGCNLTALNLPGSLVFIGRYAFAGNMVSLKLPLSDNNYSWNDSNGKIYNEGEVGTDNSYSYVARIPYTLKDEDVVVENGVITSCSYFNDNLHLASIITIPEKIDGQNITGIGNGVFFGCGISEIFLPAGIQEIENQAFSNNEIIHLILPNSLEKIGEGVFTNNCINTLTFEKTSQLQTIGMYAFNSNRLVSINFPKSVIKIEKYAFENNFLQNIYFEENSQLLSIGSRAFINNWGLKNFYLPDPKINGYDHWVDWDSNQYSVNLLVENFYSFYKIPIEYTLTDIDVEVINGIIVRYTPGNSFANILSIPDRLDGQEIIGIGGEVFRNWGLIGVDLPASLKTIDYGAFADNDILNITIPGSVEEIKGEAFYSNNIQELIFDENSRLTNIGWFAFYNNKITSLILPDNLKNIEGYAFAYNRISNILEVPESVEGIGASAFSGNNIPQLIFGENSILSYLGPFAFSNNNISNEIFIPKTLSEISDYTFQSNNISKVIIHDGIVEYGNGAFEYNNSALNIILHKPPTIPFVTHFFGWKDNDGKYHYPGETIDDFGDRYKAVIDQYFVVKFIVNDDNNVPIENATIDFYGSLLTTDLNGIDSIGPVMRGLQNYEVRAGGCFDFSGSVDVQDDMTVLVTMINYYNVNIKVIDTNNNPIAGAGLMFNDSSFYFNENGSITFSLPDGEYPIAINASGYQESISLLTVFDSDTSLFVIMKPVLVNYLPNGGTGVAFTETAYGSNFKIHDNPFVRNAYFFSHWNTNPDNSGLTYAENESIKLGYSDIDLYAVWTPVKYNIVYHLNGGNNDPNNPLQYSIESEVNLLPASKTSLYFATWIDADSNRVSRIEKGNIGDIELWAVFTSEPTYFIDYFNLENASHSNQSFYTKFDLPVAFTDAYKKGIEFIAWYEDSLFTKQITTIPAGSTRNYEVYAKWGGLIEYSITYILNGGVNNLLNPNFYTIESSSIIFSKPEKTGARFIGWFSDNALTDEITGIPSGSIGDTILYAKWELDVFEIEYELNGGINNSANPDSYTIESSSVTFKPPEKTGARFIGWFSDNALTDEITGIPAGSIGDTILYAKWELDVFVIRYFLDGGVNSSANPDNYTIESDAIFFEAPTKRGFRFIAWYYDDDLVNIISGIPRGSMGDTTLYANWEIEEYAIHYELNGGSNSLANPEEYTIESNAIVLDDPERNGFIFEGWYTNSDYSTRIISIPQGSAGDIVIYAKWIEIFTVKFIITTDGFNPAKDVDIIINNEKQLKSDDSGLADTLLADGSSLDYTIEIDGIAINNGSVSILGSDVTVRVEIVDCYMRWFDVIFCDNGKGLWTNFVWYKEDNWISNEQFYHHPDGIEEGSYKLLVTSVAGVEYIWESKYYADNFESVMEKSYNLDPLEANIFPNPVSKDNYLNVLLSETINLQNTTISVYGANGALIMTINNPFYLNEIQIDSRFSAGMYQVMVVNAQKKQRIIKNFFVK